MANNHIIVPHNYVYIERTDRTIEWDWIRIENLFCNLPETQLCLYQRSSHANPHKCFLVCLQNFDNFSILQFPEVNQTPLYWCLDWHLYVCLHFLLQEDEKGRRSKFHLLSSYISSLSLSLFLTLFITHVITLLITLFITTCHLHWQEVTLLF